VRRALLALLCLMLGATLLGACGGDDDEQSPPPREAAAQRLMAQTFATPANAVKNARMRFTFRLDPKGLLELGGPIKLNLSGPFAAARSGELPRFDTAFAATLATDRFTGALRSTGGQAFISLDGRPYRLDKAFVTKLRARVARAPGHRLGLGALGIDPRRWILKPRARGTETVDGVSVTRVSGAINLARLLEDLDSFLTKAGGSAAAGGFLSPATRREFADAIDSSNVDILSGASDHVLRELRIAAKFTFKKHGGLTPIPGLAGGRLEIRLALAGVNKTRLKVQAPAGARPLAELTGGSISDFVDGIAGALISEADNGLIGQALACITGASGSTAALVTCISKIDL
jgi:hypothetical protein